MSNINELAQAVAGGKTKIVPGLVEAAIADGAKAEEILNAMIGAMGEVGEKFTNGDIFVPEMLVAAKAMQKGLEVLKPVLASSGVASVGKCIVGTVQGDLHDIGKNLVSIMIESSGFDVIDLGVDVSIEKFLETIKANPDCNVVAFSSLLTTTMPSLKATVAAVKESGLSGFKIIVGGAPITQEFASEIGADGYADDAAGAAVLATKLVG
jgi:Predicted cobalamin binding protein